jgi:limonene-1,2-epoxide hydrolase
MRFSLVAGFVVRFFVVMYFVLERVTGVFRVARRRFRSWREYRSVWREM